MDKLTRRELAVVATASLASSLATARAVGQTPPPATNPDWYQAALASHKENSGILAQFQVAMSVEPAFQFKA